MRHKVVEQLVCRWRDMVNNGEFGEDEMILSLTEQVEHNCQGWDSALEELDINPDLKEDMGYGVELTDEQMDEWLSIVIEASKVYLDRYSRR